MASPSYWIEPPTFSSSQLLSTVQVNQIQHDINVLFGVSHSISMMFAGKRYQTGGDPNVEQKFWQGRLKHSGSQMTAKLGVRVLNGADTASANLKIVDPGTGQGSLLTSISTTNTSFDYAPSTLDLSGCAQLVTGSIYVVEANVRRIAGTADQVAATLDLLFESAGSSGWTTPPTISDGAVGAASDMNVWQDDLNWLKDRIFLDNHSWGFANTQTGDTQPNAKRLFHGYIKHTGSILNYLWAQRAVADFSQTPPGSSEAWLVYNGSTVTCATCAGDNDWSFISGSFSLAGKGLTPGEFYEVYLEAKNPESFASQIEVRLAYAYESQPIAPSGWKDLKSFSHGDTAVSASFQNISDDLTGLHEERRDMTWPIRDNYLTTGAVTPSENSYAGVSIIHRAPWLWHLGAGQVILPGGPGGRLPKSVSFEDADPNNPGTKWGSINLDELSWLHVGQRILVTGEDLVAAFESYDPS